MQSSPHFSFKFNDKSYLSLIKEKIKYLGSTMQMDAESVGKAHIVATELLTNLLKFSNDRREILLRVFDRNNKSGFELIGLDNGPGILDVAHALEDGYSTAGSQGEGLGAIKRLSDEFDIYSSYPGGTVVLSRILKKGGPYKSLKDKIVFNIQGILLPLHGQVACGDVWGALETKNEINIVALDGLGHGPEAEAASHLALAKFYQAGPDLSPVDMLTQVHEHIRQTRGAVGSMIKINFQNKEVSYCGVGNISAKIVGHGTDPPRTLSNYNGILGMNTRKMSTSTSPWDENKHIIIHSDGLNTRWDLASYKNILLKDPSIIAAVLYRDHARIKDDLMVVVGGQRK